MSQHFLLINNALTEVSRDTYRNLRNQIGVSPSVPTVSPSLGMGDYSHASAVAVKQAAEVVSEARR
jgi:hypothetical protein